MTAAAAAGAPGGSDALDPQLVNTIDHMLCRMIEGSARANQLPVGFLTRLVWEESRFRTGLTSRAGAKGVAQFMPQTAAARGLADPFVPEAAIEQAAELLAEFHRQFGNLGLAAAAYNAGGGRVAQWLRGQAMLSMQTRNYVRLVTGRPGEEWAALKARGASVEGDADPIISQSCIVLTADLRRANPSLGAGYYPPALREWAWQIRLGTNLARVTALVSSFAAQAANLAATSTAPSVAAAAALPQPARRGAPDDGPPPLRAAAEELCDSTRAFGISCAVYTR
jgi:soluble lytic murein transglycosylase-like protein